MVQKKKDAVPTKPVKQFTAVETEMLIDEVECHPCLYNSSLPDYKNEATKALARATIATKFTNCTPNDVAVKWKVLRDQFARCRKELSEVPPSGSSGDESTLKRRSKKAFPFYEQLQFLHQHVKQRMRTDNMKELVVQQASSATSLSDKPHSVIAMNENDIPLMDELLNDSRRFSVDAIIELSDTSASSNRDTENNLDESAELSNGGDEHEKETVTRDENLENLSPVNDKKSIDGKGTEPEVTKKKKNHGFEDISDPPARPTRKRPHNSLSENDKQLDSVVVALSSLASAVTKHPPRIQQQQQPMLSVPAKSSVLLECEEYCLNFAKKMASIENERARDFIRSEMEKLYFDQKHNIF